MQSAAIISTDKGFCVQGHVGFSNVVRLRHEGEKLLATLFIAKNAIEIDLSEMKDQDASPLSLLLCWMRFSKKNKSKLHFMHMPQSLQRMSNLFGLIDLWTN